MQDRVPLYPGRVKMTPVAGQANTYDMVRADDPTQAGTPLNKATFLKDATAALYGLGTGAVPDNVLAALGKYKQHWWSRKSTPYNEIKTESSSQNLVKGSGEATITYSDTISIAENTGEITLVNPQTVYIANTNGNEAVLLGKYCQTDGVSTPEIILFFPLNGVSWTYYTGHGVNNYIKGTPCYIVTSEPGEPQITYVQSSDRSAYPDSGTSGGYEYEYLGIPFDNAVTAPKIETGSYVGTGTYGQANPNTLTFGFVPKLVIIGGRNYQNTYGSTIAIMDSAFFMAIAGKSSSLSPDSSSYEVVSITGNSMSWYTTENKVDYQFNLSGSVYHYIAIG